MVEKLTDQNLELEEKIEQLNETVADLEALRDLSEEQEELRMEVEHDLREELDMSLNGVRQVSSLSLPRLSPSYVHSEIHVQCSKQKEQTFLDWVKNHYLLFIHY